MAFSYSASDAASGRGQRRDASCCRQPDRTSPRLGQRRLGRCRSTSNGWDRSGRADRRPFTSVALLKSALEHDAGYPRTDVGNAGGATRPGNSRTMARDCGLTVTTPTSGSAFVPPSRRSARCIRPEPARAQPSTSRASQPCEIRSHEVWTPVSLDAAQLRPSRARSTLAALKTNLKQILCLVS